MLLIYRNLSSPLISAPLLLKSRKIPVGGAMVFSDVVGIHHLSFSSVWLMSALPPPLTRHAARIDSLAGSLCLRTVWLPAMLQFWLVKFSYKNSCAAWRAAARCGDAGCLWENRSELCERRRGKGAVLILSYSPPPRSSHVYTTYLFSTLHRNSTVPTWTCLLFRVVVPVQKAQPHLSVEEGQKEGVQC